MPPIHSSRAEDQHRPPENRPPLALVTGANRGLGREVSQRLGGLGFAVLLGCRDAARARAAAGDLRAEGFEVVPVLLDVTDPASVSAVAARIKQHYGGRLDVLVNNAGIFLGETATATTAAHLRPMFETNVIGVVTVTQTMLPLLSRSPAARIVNVSSTTASLGLTAAGTDIPGDASQRMAYASTKAALNMLTLHYAAAFAVDPRLAHVKINAAAPGWTATRMNQFQGARTVAEGARVIVNLAVLDADGPNGGFFDDAGPVPW